MQNPDPPLAANLESFVRREVEGVRSIRSLRRLSGGASLETWSFEAITRSGVLPLILRRSPIEKTSTTGVPLSTEARLLELAAERGVPVARPLAVLRAEDELGSGYLMERLEGESIARKILRDERFAPARRTMARQCGEILGRIHAVPLARLPELASLPGLAHLERYRKIYASFDEPHPVFELALGWLEERLPEDGEVGLVHGDFRNGNLLVGPEGIRAVLDWELAHLGNPAEDLGWICVNSWRFGHPEKPVGGFGEREDLLAGYEAAGGRSVAPEEMHVWEVFGTLRWGIMCMMQGYAHLQGSARSVEKAAIGRRTSETEIDLLALLQGRT